MCPVALTYIIIVIVTIMRRECAISNVPRWRIVTMMRRECAISNVPRCAHLHYNCDCDNYEKRMCYIECAPLAHCDNDEKRMCYIECATLAKIYCEGTVRGHGTAG